MSGIKLDTQAMPKKMSTKRSSGVAIIIGLTTVISGIFLFLGIKDYLAMHNMQLTWDVIFNIATDTDEMPDMELTGDDGDNVTVSPDNTIDDPLFRFINFEGLLAVNEDVSGYIYIPNTKVDYPILKETVPNIYYYQNHNINREEDIYGSIFELSDAQIGDSRVNWLFGHHMASGDMFSDILKFERNELDINTPVYIYRQEYRTRYKVAAVCVVDKNDMIYNFDCYGRDSDPAVYQALIDHIVSTNRVKTDVTLNTSTDLVVLSTCKGRAGTSTRCAVICVPDYTYTNMAR